MRVLMKVDMSGTRDGQPWPARGNEVELSDQEAAKLCANGLATPVRSDEVDVEKRAKPKAKAKPAAKRGDK